MENNIKTLRIFLVIILTFSLILFVLIRVDRSNRYNDLLKYKRETSKLDKEITIGGLDYLKVDNIYFEKIKNETYVTGDIKNTSDNAISGELVKVSLKDKNGVEIFMFIVTLDMIEPHGSLSFQSAATQDLSSVSDYEIVKLEKS